MIPTCSSWLSHIIYPANLNRAHQTAKVCPQAEKLPRSFASHCRNLPKSNRTVWKKPEWLVGVLHVKQKLELVDWFMLWRRCNLSQILQSVPELLSALATMPLLHGFKRFQTVSRCFRRYPKIARVLCFHGSLRSFQGTRFSRSSRTRKRSKGPPQVLSLSKATLSRSPRSAYSRNKINTIYKQKRKSSLLVLLYWKKSCATRKLFGQHAIWRIDSVCIWTVQICIVAHVRSKDGDQEAAQNKLKTSQYRTNGIDPSLKHGRHEGIPKWETRRRQYATAPSTVSQQQRQQETRVFETRVWGRKQHPHRRLS